MPDIQLIATAAFGLEAVVARELSDLGYGDTHVEAGRVRFRADEQAICRTNLWLRVSDRVLVEVGRFRATDFGALFDGVEGLPWEEWLPANARFPVRGRSVRSQLSSVPACQRIVKKAIVERLRRAHRVQTLPEDGPSCPVAVALLNNEASLAIDTSGVGLHKRGFRDRSGPAPLKETLAAGLVLLSFWRSDRPLIDPFCGTGTIPIEAALIAARMAPGRSRSFAAEQWPRLAGQAWARAREEARELAASPSGLSIRGFDSDRRVIALAQRHAQRAGVQEFVRFECRAFEELASEEQFGCLIANPPYGERLGDRGEARDLYRSMPGVLRRLPTWSHFLLVASRDFEGVVGQEADRRRKLYNGRIECTYYQFHGPPPSKAAGRVTSRLRDGAGTDAGGGAEAESEAAPAPPVRAVFGGLPEGAAEQAELLRRRLEKRVHHLRRLPTRQGITCFRIYDCDVPGVPLMIDRYEDYVHVSEYARAGGHAPAQHLDWLDLMTETIAQALDVPADRVFVKARHRQRGIRQHQRVAEQEFTTVVHEGGLQFLVNLSDYIDTGLFLDHRVTRGMVRDLAKDASVLNLFSYTGAFTVYAAAGGAGQTCSVDLSPRYLAWAQRNMELNGFSDPERHRFVRQDVRQFLEDAAARGLAYDLAILDPPTFSNSKATDEDYDVQQHHGQTINRVLKLLRPGGMLFFSTNFRKFKFADAEIRGASEIREITRQTVPPDFARRRPHRCWRIRRN